MRFYPPAIRCRSLCVENFRSRQSIQPLGFTPTRQTNTLETFVKLQLCFRCFHMWCQLFLCCLVMFLHSCQWCDFQWCHRWCHLFILFYFPFYRVLLTIHPDRLAHAAWLRFQVPALCHPFSCLFYETVSCHSSGARGGISSPLFCSNIIQKISYDLGLQVAGALTHTLASNLEWHPSNFAKKKGSCECLLPLHCLHCLVMFWFLGFSGFAFTCFNTLTLI